MGRLVVWGRPSHPHPHPHQPHFHPRHHHYHIGHQGCTCDEDDLLWDLDRFVGEVLGVLHDLTEECSAILLLGADSEWQVLVPLGVAGKVEEGEVGEVLEMASDLVGNIGRCV
jgi:hypothetical protein